MKRHNFVNITLVLALIIAASYYAVYSLVNYYEKHKLLESTKVSEKEQNVTSSKNEIDLIKNDLKNFSSRLGAPENSGIAAGVERGMSLINKSLMHAMTEPRKNASEESLYILPHDSQIIISKVVINFLLKKGSVKQLEIAKKIAMPERFTNLLKKLEEHQNLLDSDQNKAAMIFPTKYHFFEKILKIERKSASRVQIEKLENQIEKEIPDLIDFIYSSKNELGCK